MASGQPFPQYLLHEIHQYPGNDRCCDCHSLDTDWASVTHGTLICLECAGKHRSLGVSVSFVRSISMDTWSKRQLEMMRQGGNGQIKRFFRRLEVLQAVQASVRLLYNSREADHYRRKLEERVDQICNGELKSHVRIFRKVKSGANEFKSVEELSRVTASSIYSVKFGLGPLGITMTKDYNGEAVISRVANGSPAEQAGIMPGDYVKGVANIFSDKYDDIMAMITGSSRPFTILLLRCSGAGAPGSPRTSPSQRRAPSSSSSLESGRVERLLSHDQEDIELTEEDAEASPVELMQRLELSIGSTDIRRLSSLVLGPAGTDLGALSAGSLASLRGLSLEEQPSPVPVEEGAEDDREGEEGGNGEGGDSDDWVEEDAVPVGSRSFSTDDLDAAALSPPKASLGPPTPKPKPRSGFTLTVTFDQLPLGFTLSPAHDAKAEVVRLREGGRAMQLGVSPGDVLVGVDGRSVAHYHDAMELLSHVALPVRLTFFRAATHLRNHSDLTGSATGWGQSASTKTDHDEAHGHGHGYVPLKKNLSFSNVEGLS